MRRLKELPRLLLTLPNIIRVGLLILSLILCMGIHLLTYPTSHNGSLLIIPGVLAAWMFKKQGLLAGIVAELPLLVVYHSIRLKSIWWPLSFALFFWGGFLIALAICAVIVSARTLVDSSEAARQEAEKAERQMAIAYDQQVQLNKLKDQFLLNVSHELRTPLAVLGNSLELLFGQYEYLNRIQRAEVLVLATKNHEELVSLVDRVLDAITIAKEFSPTRCKVVPVRQIVEEVLAHFDPRDVRAYMFHVYVPEQVVVWADPQFLRQVLRNLLGNIFKYVPKQTEIRIETAQPTPSSLVCLTVQDAGPGIPPEELPHLFEKFVRLRRDLAGKTRGMGLGLYLCKQLVEAMGGQIWVESSGRIGEGSRFCLTLPASSPLTDTMYR
jgi:signal transduction histidine kinase